MFSPPRKFRIQHYRAAIAFILLLGFAIRIWRIDIQPLSGDEAFSIMNWTRTSLQHLLGVIALIDPQPPAALLSLYGWVRLVGDTEFAARMLSALASTLTVAAACGITRQLVNRQAALLAGLLTAFNPYQIWYAQDLRSYSLWMAASATTLWFLLRALRRPNRPGYWIAYILSAAVSIYTFYLELFVLVTHNLFALWTLRSRRQHLITWFSSQAVIALLLAPWFLRPELRRSDYNPTGGAPDLIDAVITLTAGRTFVAAPEIILPNRTVSLSVLIVLALVISSLGIVWSMGSKTAALWLTLHAFIPPLLLSVLTTATQRGYFNPRYVGASSMSLIVLITVAIYTLSVAKTKGAAALALSGATILAVVYTRSLAHYHFDSEYAKSPAWRDIVEQLDLQTQPADLIIRNFPDPAFDYYYHGPTPAITLPLNENAPAAITHAELQNLAETHDYLWFLPIQSAAFDQERTVAIWLETNTQFISDQWVGPTRILQYASWEKIPSTYVRLPMTDFADTAYLLGFRITPPDPEWNRGSTIFLELFWEPYRTTEKPLTLFVHLLGPIGPHGSPLWAQDDHPPQRQRISSLSWQLNQPFRDVSRLVIPANAPSGKYSLTAGLYNPVTGERISLRHGPPSMENDAVVVLSFVLP